MGFLNQLKASAKNVGSSFNESNSIDIVKKRINEENKKITSAQMEIGTLYYDKHAGKAGADADAKLEELCKKIDDANKAIEDYNKEIEKIKAAGEEERAANKAEADAADAREAEEKAKRKAEAEAAKQAAEQEPKE